MAKFTLPNHLDRHVGDKDDETSRAIDESVPLSAVAGGRVEFPTKMMAILKSFEQLCIELRLIIDLPFDNDDQGHLDVGGYK